MKQLVAKNSTREIRALGADARDASNDGELTQADLDAIDASFEHAITLERSGTGLGDWACVVCKPCNFIGPRRYEYDGSMMQKLDGDAAAHVNARVRPVDGSQR